MSGNWHRDPFKLFGILILGIILAVFAGSILGAWSAVEAGALDAAANIATFASAVGTFALVTITSMYTYSTWKLVKETKEAREQEVDIREEERKRERQKLRRALKKEIEMGTAWADEKVESGNFSTAQASYPTFVFESNTQNLGHLSNGEMMTILNFYNNALSLEEMIELRRTNPVPDDTIIKQMLTLREIGNKTIDTIGEQIEEESTDRLEVADARSDENRTETESHEE